MEYLLSLYLKLGSGILAGLLLGYLLPNTVPQRIGQFLFWVGVPLGVLIFLRQADLSGPVWLAPVLAWSAILLSAGIAWLWMSKRRECPVGLQAKPVQGSFFLAAMIGNTGYLGYPVALTLVGPQYFAWTLLYDIFGSTLGAYSFGVALAAHFGTEQLTRKQFLQAILINPTLWSLGFGLLLKAIPLPRVVEQTLEHLAWTIVASAIVLIGMRLRQLSSWHRFEQAAIAVVIKMLVVPLILGFSLAQLGFTGWPQLAIVLQAAMPPAFSTLVIAEAYSLDRDLSVSALALGTTGLLVMLPVWLWLFGVA